MPSGLISTSNGSSGASNISAASFAKGATDRPWKDDVQSMCDGSFFCSFIGSSEKPEASVAEVGVFEDEGGVVGGGILLVAAVVVVADLGAASAL